MTNFREVVAGSGNIGASAETVLASASIVVMNPGGECLIRADVWADFLGGVLNGGPSGLTLRIYDSPDKTGAVIATSSIQAEYAPDGLGGWAQGVLAQGTWTIACVHTAGVSGDHAHCVTAQQTAGQVNSPYTCVLEMAGLPAGY